MQTFSSHRAQFHSMLTKTLNPNLCTRLVAIFCVLTGMLSGALRADTTPSPLHLRLTEANYDRARSRLILTVRLQPTDLEAALSDYAHRKITAADPVELAPLALDYVRDTLHLKSPRGTALRLEWAGFDVTKTQIFLFFESALPSGLQGTCISDKLLQERFADQIGHVGRDLVFALHQITRVAVVRVAGQKAGGPHRAGESPIFARVDV